MRRHVLLLLVFASGVCAGLVFRDKPKVVAAERPLGGPRNVMIGYPDPQAPNGRKYQILTVTPPVPLGASGRYTDEWVITVLTDTADGGTAAVSYVAR